MFCSKLNPFLLGRTTDKYSFVVLFASGFDPVLFSQSVFHLYSSIFCLTFLIFWALSQDTFELCFALRASLSFSGALGRVCLASEGTRCIFLFSHLKRIIFPLSAYISPEKLEQGQRYLKPDMGTQFKQGFNPLGFLRAFIALSLSQ